MEAGAIPLAEFFESFQLIATPVYGSVYFPGSAMLYAPGVWLHLPHWVIPLLASAGVVTMVYVVFTELIDGIAGLLGVILILSNPIFREMSIMVMAGVPAMLGALLLIWIYLRWRTSQGIGWTVAMGIIAGWLAITRPVDSLTVIVPVGIAVLLNLRKSQWKRVGVIVVAGLAGVVPFLAVQGIFDLHVTGRLLDTPFDFYTRQVYPAGDVRISWRRGPAVRPAWRLPQVQQAYDALAAGLMKEHTPLQKLKRWPTEYLPDTIQTSCRIRCSSS